MNVTKELIKRHKLSLEEIAARVGASSNSVRNWSNGIKPIKIFERQLEKLFEEEEANSNKEKNASNS